MMSYREIAVMVFRTLRTHPRHSPWLWGLTQLPHMGSIPPHVYLCSLHDILLCTQVALNIRVFFFTLKKERENRYSKELLTH